MKRRILLVDDDDASRISLLAILSDVGYDTSGAASLADMRNRLNEEVFDLLLLDVHLPDGEGPDALSDIRRISPSMPVAILTGEAYVHNTGAFEAVLTKGTDPAILLQKIKKMIR